MKENEKSRCSFSYAKGCIFRGPPLCRLIDELHAPTLFGGRQSISKIPLFRVFQDDKVHPRTGGHFTHTFVLF